jgi:hypothetical protein
MRSQSYLILALYCLCEIPLFYSFTIIGNMDTLYISRLLQHISALLWYASCCVSIRQWYIWVQSTQQRFETQ